MIDRSRALQVIVEFVLIFLVLLLTVNLGLKYALGVKYPLAVVVSGSMRPQLKEGDLLIVTSTNPHELDEGDIIVFYAPWSKDPVVHRIVKIESSGGARTFKTKGDANSVMDPGYRTPSDIYGKFAYRVPIPYLGYFLLFVKNKYVKAVLIISLGYLIIREILERSRSEKEGSEGS